MSIGVFIVPFSYACSDVITEVYGYKISKQIIWFGLFSELLFDSICYFASIIKSPSFYNNDLIYNQILHPLIYVYFAVLIASIVSDFSNIYFLSKWKVLMRGKYFWLRSIGASWISEFVFTVMCDGLVFSKAFSTPKVLHTILSTFFIKMICAIILSLPISLLAAKLKRIEDIDVDDRQISFKPLTVSI